jgi:hypothetical protein
LATIAFAGENRDLQIALIVVFALAVATGLWFTSRMRKRARESGFSDLDRRSAIAGLRLSEVLAFASCWIAGAGALLWLKNLQ